MIKSGRQRSVCKMTERMIAMEIMGSRRGINYNGEGDTLSDGTAPHIRHRVCARRVVSSVPVAHGVVGGGGGGALRRGGSGRQPIRSRGLTLTLFFSCCSLFFPFFLSTLSSSSEAIVQRVVSRAKRVPPFDE